MTFRRREIETWAWEGNSFSTQKTYLGRNDVLSFPRLPTKVLVIVVPSCSIFPSKYLRSTTACRWQLMTRRDAIKCNVIVEKKAGIKERESKGNLSLRSMKSTTLVSFCTILVLCKLYSSVICDWWKVLFLYIFILGDLAWLILYEKSLSRYFSSL